MRWIRAVTLAFSTYTRIPMPGVKWDDDAMKCAIAFLPLVGAVIGAAVWAWAWICGFFGVGTALFAAVTAALPILITGGIHMDGYCDTSDALACWQDKERRLEILKDPHIGAFALIRCVCYLLLSFGLLCELHGQEMHAGLPFVYALSRCLAAWSALTMPGARKDGMLADFTKQAERRTVFVLLALFSILSAVGLLWWALPGGAAALLLCVPVTLWYRDMAGKRFGGVTGDTTGFYLQIVELSQLAGLTAGGLLWHTFY